MTSLLEDAKPGQRFEDKMGAIWVYLGRSGVDDDANFPHLLRCLDTDRTDQFTPEGWDAVTPAYRLHPLVWRVV